MSDLEVSTATTKAPDRAFRRRLLIDGGVIIAILAIVGVVQGVLWAWVAPGEQVKVYADGSYGALPTADFHPFVDLALFVLSGIVIGLVAGAAVWQVRSIRGVGALLALVIGSLIGAALAYWIGLALVSGVDPATVGATGKDHIVVQSPRLSTPLVMLAQPAFAAAVYTFLAAWNGRPDLGRTGAPAAELPAEGAVAGQAAEVAESAAGEPAEPQVVMDPAAGTSQTDPSPATD